mmetsp:Transcript_39651/g.60728  ORF Transcript_39651/g.60728 Transcript_39651/m.60728 type:complete len:91 (-) Transcript_39651:432-704(-)
MKYIEDNKLDPLPEEYTDERRLGFRYLQGNKWHYESTYEAIFDHKTWKDKAFPMDGSKYLPFLTSGALYIASRAKEGHQPVIVIDVPNFI